MKAKLLIVLLSLTFLVVFPELALAQLGSISGRVTDEVTGYPIMGAHVWARDDTTQPGGFGFDITDSLGFYMIDSLHAGAFFVSASAPGYQMEHYPDSVMVIAGQNTPDVDFALTPVGGETGSISGRVADEVTGYPIVGAAVTVSGIYSVWYTDSTGYYLCDSLPPGSYLVNANKEGYIPETYPDSVIVLAGENSPGIDFALTPIGEYGSISGRVTDEETGLPIIMAHLVALGVDNWCYGEAWSDTGGYYMIPNLCAGIYQVNANKPGYVPETYPDSVGVIAGENTPHIDFALTPIGGETGSISGRVTDEVTGIPLPMAHVLAYDSTFCAGDAWTDTAGYYLIQNLPARQYIVAVHKAGYVDEVYPESVTVEEGQNTPDIDFALTPIGGPEFGSISGRVTDEQTGHPIIMAEITIVGIYCVWYTDTAGYYFCGSLPPGSYLVNAHKEGYIPETYPDSVIVLAGENSPGIDFALTPIGEYGSISGRVTDEETGLPIIMAHLVALGVDNWCYGEAWSDTGGYYMIPNLCPGIYQVNANKPGYVPETYPDSVVVIGGENTSDIDFALLPMGEPGSISGTITDSVTEEPIPYAHVCAYGEFGHSQAWTDSLGQYTIFGLCPGCYFVTAWAWSYWPQDYPDTVCVMEGQNTPGIDFALVPHGGPGEGVIAGQVFEDTTFLMPIPFAIVFAISLDGNWGFDFTDSVGAYMIHGLATDDYYVYAFAPGYIGEFYDGVYTWEEATLVTPDAHDIDFYLAPCGPGGGRISGVIHSEGLSVEGAFVYAEASGEVKGFARSSTEGGYVINGLLPGTYTVSASKVWYHDGSYPDPIEIGSGKASEIDIELPPIQVGDVTEDGAIDIGDVIFIINYLYLSGPAPDPLMAGDVNCDGVVNIADVIYIINYLYINGPSPCYP